VSLYRCRTRKENNKLKKKKKTTTVAVKHTISLNIITTKVYNIRCLTLINILNLLATTFNIKNHYGKKKKTLFHKSDKKNFYMKD
jgi:hypothetical protein